MLIPILRGQRHPTRAWFSVTGLLALPICCGCSFAWVHKPPDPQEPRSSASFERYHAPCTASYATPVADTVITALLGVGAAVMFVKASEPDASAPCAGLGCGTGSALGDTAETVVGVGALAGAVTFTASAVYGFAAVNSCLAWRAETDLALRPTARAPN